MDIEFHYYMTYLIAARAGFPPEEARTLAHACQHVDDNCYLISVDADSPETAYTNYISQTLDITRPRKAMLRVYPAFHFVPGDPVEKGAARKDGLMHKLNTTPAGANAVEMLESALVSVNIYRIGIACHAYADTWAHQNFAGYHHEFNEMSGPDYKRLVPCIGHGEAGHNPDIPGLVWEDPRLQVPEVDNRERFAAAARDLYVRLKEYRDGDASDAEALVDDLRSAIGDPDESGGDSAVRIARYRNLATLPEYGGERLPDYIETEWFEEAVETEVRGFRDTAISPMVPDFLQALQPRDRYRWRNHGAYSLSDWYLFQEAVKEHQRATLEILRRDSLDGLVLPHFWDVSGKEMEG